jgi:GTP cyclohydrolase I
MMRGVKKAQTNMITRTMLGSFQQDPNLRAEFLAQAGRSNE